MLKRLKRIRQLMDELVSTTTDERRRSAGDEARRQRDAGHRITPSFPLIGQPVIGQPGAPPPTITEPCTVLIATSGVLPTLNERTSYGGGEVLAFADTDVFRALAAIMSRRPAVIMLERRFAATPRGAALCHRIKADPMLTHAEIVVVSPDTDGSRGSRRPSGDGPVVAVLAPPAAAAAQASYPTGTRRAPRLTPARQVDLLVDGKQATLLDLSTFGAQVISAARLTPKQRLRVVLPDERGAVRISAVVVWASLEISSTIGPRYRAGIEFLDAKGATIDAY